MSIFEAVEAGDVNAFEKCLREYPSGGPKDAADLRNENGESLLHVSIRAGQEGMVKRLLVLDFDANAEIEDSSGVTCLHLACKQGERDIVRLLLNHGGAGKGLGAETSSVDIDARDRDGLDAFHYAAYGGNVSIMRLLCNVLEARGGNYEAGVLASNLESRKTFSDALSPLDIAIKCGHQELAGYLVSEQGMQKKDFSTAEKNHSRRHDDQVKKIFSDAILAKQQILMKQRKNAVPKNESAIYDRVSDEREESNHDADAVASQKSDRKIPISYFIPMLLIPVLLIFLLPSISSNNKAPN